MIDRLKIWSNSKPWFWKYQAWLGRLGFIIEHNTYKTGIAIAKTRSNARILGAFAWIGVKSLFWVVLILAGLNLGESYLESDLSWLQPFSADEKDFNIEQLRLYAQLLTAVFSIYFATIGIILSSGYTRLRRDIIQMLTTEQVGSVYSQVLVLAAIFCLVATALPLFGLEPGRLVYTTGTALTLLSALALFPLGQRLFNFYDLNLLVRSEIIPQIARHIENAAKPGNSMSLANHHSKAARRSLEQLSYIDDRAKVDTESLKESLPALTDAYTALLLHYLQRKHAIDQESYWFPRQRRHKQWFFAGDSATSMALQTSNQLLLMEEKPDRQWLENDIVERLASHIDLAFRIGDFDLALILLGRFSGRISDYAAQFQFDVGMKELKRLKEIIELGLAKANTLPNNKALPQTLIAIADTWAGLGSNLCLETLRRMFTFENELRQFFDRDTWSKKSLRTLPAFLQVELAFIIERIEFELDIEGQRLSKPKYVQQLAVQKLLFHYAKILPDVCDFYQSMVPDFTTALAKLNMSQAGTQVVLASLHSHWKLPRWFDELAKLLERYREYEHYKEDPYLLPKIEVAKMATQIEASRDLALATLGNGSMVEHIFDPKHDDALPDHFGQIYFELAEACIHALEQNEKRKLDHFLPMFMTLAFLAADSKFPDPALDINDEYRLHLISTVINDLASVMGFAILYGAYFENEELPKDALSKFDIWIDRAPDKQRYLKRMLMLSNAASFSISASPREMIRINWKISFEERARQDGFGGRIGFERKKRHPNKIVREFLSAFSEASHLFFAIHIVPQIESPNFKIDRHITDLVRRLGNDNSKGQNENS